MENILVVTVKEWNILNYLKLKEKYEDRYSFHLLTNNDELNYNSVSKLNPLYIFFPHWSWKIPSEIYTNYNCIVFHMTDLPFGRGGSPLQNLIIREIYDTKISALKVDDGIDSGDIYLKENFNISLGSAEENFMKLSSVIFGKMIPRFLNDTLIPKRQEGKATNFKRRNSEDSNLSKIEIKTIDKLYDMIRMLDAEGYPNAYLLLDNIKILFKEVHLKNNKLVGRFEAIANE